MIMFKRPAARTLIASCVIAAIGFFSASGSSIAGGIQCQPRFIAQNIQHAVLALKASEYCTNSNLPYTVADAQARIDSLRCGDEADKLIDDLMSKYDRAYRTILRDDAKGTICGQAATLLN